MAGFGDAFVLTVITPDPEVAALAVRAGVDRVGVDLEILGKEARQRNTGSRISRHSLDDLTRLAAGIPEDRLFARINPPHDGTAADVERVLAAGAGNVMLPYASRPAEVSAFVQAMAGRGTAIALLETPEALHRIAAFTAIDGISEIMIGLNDLRLALGLPSPFEVLASPLLTTVCGEVVASGKRLAIGGVTSPEHRGLPVDPDLVLAQYPRLGARGAWLSRSFVDRYATPEAFAPRVAMIRNRLSELAALPAATLAARRDALLQAVHRLPAGAGP